MNNIWSPSRHIGGMYLRGLLAIAAVLITSAFSVGQSSVIVSEEFTWQSQSVAQTTCNSYKHTLTGPGVLTIRTKMSPFRVRDLGMSSEDILTHGVGYFAESLGRTVNGMEGANTNEFIGKPIDRISRWKIDGNKHNVEFKVCNPVKCNLAGDCAQYQATASILVDFAASTKATSMPSATTDSTRTNVIGVWVRTREGRVIDRMEIRASGDGYSVELREGDNAPLYAKGFGVLHGSRIVAATRNSSDGVSGLLVLSFKGDGVHYRSYYLDGRMSWDGDFIRRP